MTTAVPSREDFTHPDETIVHPDPASKPDERGRTRFTAFWITNQEWVPNGIRAQIFYTNLDDFVTRAKAPATVRIVAGEQA